MTPDDDRRARLLAAKARGLVADHLAIASDAIDAAPMPDGAAVRVDGSLWVLLDSVRGLGPAIALAERRAADRFHVMADPTAADGSPLAGILARRAGQFVDGPEVWAVDGRRLLHADVATAADRVEPSAEALSLVGLLVDAGVEVTVEHGAIRGEVRGLEIARIVDDGDGARIEVGVGRHDREAFTMVHGNLPTADALRSVIASVDSVRRAEAEAHPLRRLAPEGWLRSLVVARPGIVDAVELAPAEPPVPRESVKDTAAAIAVGVGADGGTVVVACSVGIDLDLVPTAADARALVDESARLVAVVPTRDLHPVTERLAARLHRPARIVTVPDDWRSGIGS